MSAQEGRDAPTPSLALYDHALRLLPESPDGVPPRRGHPLPRKSASRDGLLSRKEAKDAIREALSPLPADPVTLHRRFERHGIQDQHRHFITSAIAELPLPPEQADRARALGRRLTRAGTTVPTVTTGIALLGRLGEPEDVPTLRLLGMFRDLIGPVVHALDTLDRQSAAVVWLAAHVRRDDLQALIQALWTGNRQAVHPELVALPASPRYVSSAAARRVAEACQLPELLDRHPADTRLLARAGRLLGRMGRSCDDPTDLLAYRDARRLYDCVVNRSGLLPPTLDNAAMLLSLALDLSSGTGVLLDWPPGRRAALLERLGTLVAEPAWVAAAGTGSGAEQRRRADWIRRTGRKPFTLPATPDRIRIEVVSRDPVDREPVETRVLIDGRPVVPAVFSRGPAHSPEYLLDEGRLRPGEVPREVQLAEAGCTEGCCGALYVTIRRDGDQVVWEKWRHSMAGLRDPASELPTYRFDASAYDAEITRAETDSAWSWRARTIARLIKAGLIEEPDLLSRWDAGRGWIGSDFEDPDTAVVTFWYVPGLTSGRPERADNSLQFRWAIPDDGTPPENQARAALRRLAEEDPKSYARLSCGNRERAQELGFPWPAT